MANKVTQIVRETFEQIKKTPGEMAGVALEQLGLKTGGTGQQSKTTQRQPTLEEKNLTAMKAKDFQIAQRQIAKLEQGIKELRQQREQQLETRRQQPVQEQSEVKEAVAAPAGKRRMPGLPGRRQIKTAQTKAGAETGPARRTSG